MTGLRAGLAAADYSGQRLGPTDIQLVCADLYLRRATASVTSLSLRDNPGIVGQLENGTWQRFHAAVLCFEARLKHGLLSADCLLLRTGAGKLMNADHFIQVSTIRCCFSIVCSATFSAKTVPFRAPPTRALVQPAPCWPRPVSPPSTCPTPAWARRL